MRYLSPDGGDVSGGGGGSSGVAPGGAPASQAPSGGSSSPASSFAVPEGYSLVSKGDWDSREKLRAEYEGTKPWRERAERYKLKPEQLDEIVPTYTKIKNSGVGIDKILEALNEVGDPRAAEMEKLRGEFGEFKKEQALGAHKSAIEREAKLRDEKLAALLGDSPDDLKAVLKDAAEARYERARREKKYGEDHPLHKDHSAPLGDDELVKLLDSFKEIPKKLQAAYSAQIGKKAVAGTSGATAAGNNTGGGAAKTEQGGRETDKERRERAAAYLENLQSTRAARTAAARN